MTLEGLDDCLCRPVTFLLLHAHEGWRSRAPNRHFHLTRLLAATMMIDWLWVAQSTLQSGAEQTAELFKSTGMRLRFAFPGCLGFCTGLQGFRNSLEPFSATIEAFRDGFERCDLWISFRGHGKNSEVVRLEEEA